LLLRASVEALSLTVIGRSNHAVTRRRCRNRQRARGAGRHGVSRPCGTIWSNSGGHGGRGEKLRSRAVPTKAIACMQSQITKRNLRGKRQDPWREANGRTFETGAVLTDKGRAAEPNSATQPGPVRPQGAGRCTGRPGQEASPDKPPPAGRTTPWWPVPLRNRNGLLRPWQSSAASGNWQPCNTRRVEQERQMPVIGEREHGELPPP
jgi:hypothetical protein